MALFGRNKNSTGLDIGSGFIKLVQVDHSGDKPEVTRVAIRPLLPDAIVEGEVMDPGLVARTVRELMDDSGIKPDGLVASIGGHDVIIKKITMERMAEDDARQVLPFEAERHVPFDPQSVELDFQILDPDGTDPNMEVLLVAAKRDLVQDKLALLGDAGLEPRIIDVDAFALHNAFRHNHPEAGDGVTALVNVGHEMTNVNILVDGVPILTRDIPSVLAESVRTCSGSGGCRRRRPRRPFRAEPGSATWTPSWTGEWKMWRWGSNEPPRSS